MRRRVLFLLLLAAACSGEPGSPSDPEPFDWYQLASVDGAELPQLEANGDALYLGVLELRDPYYHLSLSWETPTGVGVDSLFAGSYEIDGAVLVLNNLRDGQDVEFSMPVEGVVVGEIWPGRVMEFWQSWP